MCGTVREFVTAEELDEAIRLVNCPPHLMPICNAIRAYRTEILDLPENLEIEIQNLDNRCGIYRYPVVKIRVFGYPSKQPKLWFLRSEDPFGIGILLTWSLPWSNPEKGEFLAAVDQLVVLASIPNEILVIIPDYLSDKFSTYINSKTSYMKEVYPTYMYYMDQKQQQMVLAEELNLPPGYQYNEEKPEEDALVVNGTWQYASKKDYRSTEEKLRRLPNVIIRYGEQPVAYEMSDVFGFYNHQFVHEEHRRRGLGRLVELRLSQKVIWDGYWPCKTVEPKNSVVIAWSDRSPHWTRYNNDSGNPIVINFIYVHC